MACASAAMMSSVVPRVDSSIGAGEGVASLSHTLMRLASRVCMSGCGCLGSSCSTSCIRSLKDIFPIACSFASRSPVQHSNASMRNSTDSSRPLRSACSRSPLRRCTTCDTTDSSKGALAMLVSALSAAFRVSDVPCASRMPSSGSSRYSDASCALSTRHLSRMASPIWAGPPLACRKACSCSLHLAAAAMPASLSWDRSAGGNR
mmetsp:Transcript_2459/g.6504  ORF Transcript_2459/g.6504 Transcript_2459/m.6504 type:complete len:205 (+) Transcript_2459:718-1332(+)